MNRIAQRGGVGQRRSCIRIGATLAAAAAIALIAVGKPNEARAADGTTDVTVQVAEGDENLAWSVPTQIPMKATASGTLIGSDADAIAIRNLSAFPIRVKQMDTTAEAPFNLVDDVDKSSGNNDFMMSMNGIAAKQTVEFPDDGTWSMGYKGNGEGNDVLPLTVSGAKIARVTADLSQAKKAATVTWMVEPTAKEVKQDPQPSPKNGVAFAVYSANDQSLDLYKRNRKPEIGDTFNGKSVTKLVDINETKASTKRFGLFEDFTTSIKKIEVVDGGIKPVSTRHWFSAKYYATSANVVKLDVSVDSDMQYMFGDSRNFTSLDLSGWDTSKVTDMSFMFTGCSGLTTVGDISSWNTSKVTDMNYMFGNCYALATMIDLSSWDTSNVTDMSYMFSYCGLTTVGDLSGWNTSNVTDMNNMFSCCRITAIGNLSGWDTSKVTNMNDMFRGCYSLITVGDLSGWNTSSVVTMGDMFNDCSKLTTVGNLSNWNTSNVCGMNGMFSDCTSLVTVGDLSRWNTSSVIAMDGMFNGCSKLTTVGDLSNWDTSNVGNDIGGGGMSNMFNGCSELTVDCSNWNVSGVSDFDGFNSNAPGVIAPNWNS